MHFRITGIPPEPFAKLFAMSDGELALRHVLRRIADEKPGFPCRVSLRDADIGEEVLLVPFTHHEANTPYRASGAIYVRRAARETYLDTIPEQLRVRLLSVRAYDASGMMCTADVCQGNELEPLIACMFADPAVAYLHAHNAKPGCFACRIDRELT